VQRGRGDRGGGLAGDDDGRPPLLHRHPALEGAQGQLRDRLERLEDACAVHRGRLVELDGPVRVEGLIQLVEREDVREIPLVVLENARDALEREPDLGEVLPEVLEALDVRIAHRALRVGHEDDAVDALQDELARRVVEDLAGNGVQLQAGLEAANDADVEGEEVEKERPVRLGLEADHLTA
jgi:hypothetical protein